MPDDSFFTDLTVMLVSLMGGAAIVIKWYFECVWQNFKNPVAFYKQLIRVQVEMGKIDEDDLTENFKTELPIVTLIKRKTMWIELLLMLVCPVPIKGFHN